MSAIDRKLKRDLWKAKGQVLAIALVIACGIAAYVMLISNVHSLNRTREQFYREYGFPDVFVTLKRAPEGLKERLAEIEGVTYVETRVVADVKLEVKDFPEPVTGRIVSIPDTGTARLNRLFIRKGRTVEPWKDNEAVVSETFAEAHRLKPGDRLGAVINGRWKTLTVVGIALSPEFVLQTRPGAISPDYKRYGILWMGRHAVGEAYDMDGAFNDAVLALSPGSSIEDVLKKVDGIVDRYGGIGAYGRKDQISHRFLSQEFSQLESYAVIFPVVFMAVSAFLLNTTLSRTISLQRDQIAVLKAFGYRDTDIGIHYMKMVMAIVMIGVAAGLGLGAWLAVKVVAIYAKFYRFPYLLYELRPSVALTAAFVAFASGLCGALLAVRKAVKLPPAEAMRPEPPATFRKTLVERFGPGRLLAQPTRMILRNIGRHPVKSLLTIAGIAASYAIMLGGTFTTDAVDFMVDTQFRLSRKEDMTIAFTEPTSRNALSSLKGQHGVLHTEAFRTVPARLRFGHRSYRTSIQGLEPGNTLNIPLDTNFRPVRLVPDGIVLTDYLGRILGVSPGDIVTVEALEGRRTVRQVRVAGLVAQYIGLQAYMDMHSLNRLMFEGDAISGAYLIADPLSRNEFYRRIVEMPRVAGAIVRKDEIRNFYDTQAEAFLFFTFITALLSGSIAFGIVYNSARIALSERSRELASLRVLGYTQAEVSYIFLGELGFLTLAALVLGLFAGQGFCHLIAVATKSELFRIPVVITPATYSLAASVIVGSACLSGLIVRRKLDRLDLVAVLKTRE